jgi:hypothetical protein
VHVVHGHSLSIGGRNVIGRNHVITSLLSRSLRHADHHADRLTAYSSNFIKFFPLWKPKQLQILIRA